MTTQHTPGPWRIVMSAGNFDSRVNAYQVKYGRAGTPLCIVDGAGNSSMHNEANARLIAASPDLLAELKDALRVLENVWPPETRSSGIKRQLDAMRAAIAKATGEA